MFTTYVIENQAGRRYIGSTSNVEDRLATHNNISPEKSHFHKTTYKKGPWVVIWKQEFNTRLEALHFKKFLKTGVERKWLERVAEFI